MKAIDCYLDQVQNLPPAPTVAIQLLELFSDPDRDIDRIVELVRTDAALTTEALKCCNGAYSMGAEPTTDIFEAVSRLGLFEVYRIVAALLASRTMTRVRARYAPDATRLWQHTVTTAMISSLLAKRVEVGTALPMGEHSVISSLLAKRVEVVEATAFTTGLLHDVGKLIFVSVEGVRYAQMVRDARSSATSLTAAEESDLGFSHAALGARLLARWGFPENICDAVERHHQLPTAATQHQRLAATVNFANCLAHQMFDRPPHAPPAAAMSPAAMDLVKLTDKDMSSIVPQIHQALERVQGLLRMQA